MDETVPCCQLQHCALPSREQLESRIAERISWNSSGQTAFGHPVGCGAFRARSLVKALRECSLLKLITLCSSESHLSLVQKKSGDILAAHKKEYSCCLFFANIYKLVQKLRGTVKNMLVAEAMPFPPIFSHLYFKSLSKIWRQEGISAEGFPVLE